MFLKVTSIFFDDQVILAHCSNKKTLFKFDFTIVYGQNIESRRRDLWSILNAVGIMKDTTKTPWLVQGDFNTIRATEEKRGGNKLKVKFLEGFNMLFEAKLQDLNIKDKLITWSSR